MCVVGVSQATSSQTSFRHWLINALHFAVEFLVIPPPLTLHVCSGGVCRASDASNYWFLFFITQPPMDGYGTVNSGQWLGIYLQDTVIFPSASAPVKRFAQCVLLDLTLFCHHVCWGTWAHTNREKVALLENTVLRTTWSTADSTNLVKWANHLEMAKLSLL